MNARCFKTIFSKRLGTLVAVGEHAGAQGKSASGEAARSAVLAAAILLGSLNSAFALDASALPSEHQVALGQVQVTSSGARMDIQQSSNKAILNWQSFNVGSGAKVHIQQPSASAALLNRVVGNNPSQIHGQINANGQVVLVNPNGVLVGSSGSITASAFTASTFGITDADFESGNLRFSRNGSSASVVNQGSIQTHGGYVALIGATVTHSGTIHTAGGRVDVLADHGTVRVSGAINAGGASVFIGRDEKTNVLAAVGDASGAQLESQGGFVETSGQLLKVDGARVVAKDWLLDPYNITIGNNPSTAGATPLPNYSPSQTSFILASDIANALTEGTSVTVTTAGSAGNPGTQAGDITVNANIIKTSSGTASLTLRADNHIYVNAEIGAGAGANGLNVTLLAGQTTSSGGVTISGTGKINAKAGDVLVQTEGGVISTSSGSVITGKNITINNTGTAGNKSASSNAVNFFGSTVTASENLTIRGRSTALGVAARGSNLKGKSVSIDGIGGGERGVLLFNLHGALSHIEATGEDVIINGQSNGGAAINLIDGSVKASRDINLSAVSTGSNAGLDMNISLTAGRNIELKTDALNFFNSVFINANSGQGTVTVKTQNAGTQIELGGAWPLAVNDVFNIDPASRKLGINNFELSKFNAGNLTIGDSSHTGDITIAQSMFTSLANGNLTLQTGGNIAVNNSLNVNNGSTRTLTLQAGDGKTITAGANGWIRANQVALLGNAAVTLNHVENDVNTLAADVKSLAFINKKVLTVGTVNGTVGIKTKDGATVTTQVGNLNLSQSISNSTSGHVVVGAGITRSAADTSNGDVKRPTTATISNTAANGKILVYSGSAANTSALSGLNAGFNNLKVTGNADQNVETNAAFESGSGISGSTAVAQVVFREKLNFVDGTLTDASLTKTYGDASTANTGAAATTLLSEAKEALKTAAGVNSTVTVGNGINNIVVSKSAIVDTLTDTLTGGAFNTSGFLKANTIGTYKFSGMSSTKYGVGTGIDVTVNVNPLALTGSIAQGNTTYGSALVAGTVELTNKVGSDVVSANGVTINTTGNTSTSGHLKASDTAYVGIQSVSALTGADAANYTFANVKGDYKVDRLALTGSIAQGQTTYGSALVAGAVSLTNKVGSDMVSANGVTINTTGNNSTSGHLKASDTAYVGIQSVSALTGADAANYTFANVKGDYKVDKLALTGSIAQGQTTYGSALVTGTVSLTNKVGSDVVSATGVTHSTTGLTSTSAHLKAGTHTALQSLSGITGDDAANYTFADIKGDYKVDKLAITLSGITAEHKAYDGNNSATISTSDAVFSGMVTSDVLAVASTGTFSDKNAGTAKTVSLSNTLSGTDLGNYSITQQASTTADITKKDVTLESLTASNKTYDSNTNATITTGTISGTVGTETLAISGSGTFDTKNAGTGKTVTVSDVTSLTKANGDNGGDWNNYNLTTTGSKTTTANITPRPASVTATATQLTYNGATQIQNAPTNSGLLKDDEFTIGGVAAGSAVGVFASNLRVTGADAGNYAFTITNNNLVIEAPKEKPTEVQVVSVKPVIINSTDIKRGTVTLTSNLDRAFTLSNFEIPHCERDDLTLCTCEEALNEQKMNTEDLYICFDHEENTRVH